ncbi:DUF1801 domain-containing protein [Phycicoccus sonneratiae]|uniref:DUF1801 domain-containing protein n=1 Tax=Phycicoccus sonneratiae TaxID=2807628 RepID=A0ABS2CLY4_9MICO|nr:DUF1801 domain-containing protein [Phycicoccus sonneraticus]MBM6400815.1 DUF1801 domain-containing protein [Phycicoccus sonneraticus]
MDSAEQVEAHLAGLPAPRQADLRTIHERVLAEHPGCPVSFTDGRDASGKVVTNPTIGYGERTITHADGSTRDSFRVGLTATSRGISVYVLGLDDDTHLARTYAPSIGRADVTGYCIRFRRLAVVDLDVLLAAVRDGMTAGAGAPPRRPGR